MNTHYYKGLISFMVKCGKTNKQCNHLLFVLSLSMLSVYHYMLFSAMYSIVQAVGKMSNLCVSYKLI